MQEACDAIHANNVEYVLLRQQSVPRYEVLLVLFHAMSTALTFLEAALEAAKVLIEHVKENETKVADFEVFTLLNPRFEGSLCTLILTLSVQLRQ